MKETRKLIEQLKVDQNLTDERYDSEKTHFDRKIVRCPICGKLTLDWYYICENCHWEYDDYIDNNDENEYSDVNKSSIKWFKENYESKKVRQH